MLRQRASLIVNIYRRLYPNKTAPSGFEFESRDLNQNLPMREPWSKIVRAFI